MNNQTSRACYLNRINYVICGIPCFLIAGVFFYIIGVYPLTCLSIVCCFINIIALYLIKRDRITTLCNLCCHTSNNNYDILRDSIPVNMLVVGETFKAHGTFMQNLNLRIELCSAESSSVILLFCSVASRIGTDMEAAMAKVTEDKPVILVFMHHCHKPSQMTNITVQPSRGNIVQVVHCAFHETKGLLECQENEQAVAEVRTLLQKYHS